MRHLLLVLLVGMLSALQAIRAQEAWGGAAAECPSSKRFRTASEAEAAPLVLFHSYMGSGNTWLRLMLENVTGASCRSRHECVTGGGWVRLWWSFRLSGTGSSSGRTRCTPPPFSLIHLRPNHQVYSQERCIQMIGSW